MSKSNKKGIRKIWWIAGAVLVIAILICIKKCSGGEEISVDVNKPEVKTIVETIPANGKVKPVTEVKISPDVPGEIIELNVTEGAKVTKGDLIIKIKQDTYLSAVEQAAAVVNSSKASLYQSKAQLSKAQQNYLRNKKLYEMKTISKADYEAASSEWEVAKGQLKAAEYNIKSAEAQLKEAHENLVKTTIYAPMSGIVSKLEVEKGERVVGTSQMAGTEMLRIADFEQMEVVADVNENDITRLVKGDSAIVSIDAYPDRKFKGVVREVANSSENATATSGTQATNFEVKVNILPESYADLLVLNPVPFRPGMSASVEIQTTKRENVLTVPLQAVTTRKDLSSSAKDDVSQMVFVYNQKTKTVSVKEIKTGLQDMSSIEIISGVGKDDYVVTGPFNAINKTLTNGAAVKARGVESKGAADGKKKQSAGGKNGK